MSRRYVKTYQDTGSWGMHCFLTGEPSYLADHYGVISLIIQGTRFLRSSTGKDYFYFDEKRT